MCESCKSCAGITRGTGGQSASFYRVAHLVSQGNQHTLAEGACVYVNTGSVLPPRWWCEEHHGGKIAQFLAQAWASGSVVPLLYAQFST